MRFCVSVVQRLYWLFGGATGFKQGFRKGAVRVKLSYLKKGLLKGIQGVRLST